MLLAAVGGVLGCEEPVELDTEARIATKGRRLKNCTWVSFTDTAKTMMAQCPAETHVVSGGCLAQTRIVNSAPFESSNNTNLPEHDERFQDVTAQSGWACTYEGPTQTAGQKAVALCCE